MFSVETYRFATPNDAEALLAKLKEHTPVAAIVGEVREKGEKSLILE